LNHIDKISVSVDYSLRVSFFKVKRKSLKRSISNHKGKKRKKNVLVTFRFYEARFAGKNQQKGLIMEIYGSCCVKILLILLVKPENQP